MSERSPHRPFPRGPLFGAFALVLLTLLLAGVTRFTGMGAMTIEASPVLDSRDLRFEDRKDGSVAVLQADDGTVVEILAPGTNGFVRSVLRGLARERKMHGIGEEPPFRLTHWADGRLSLEDTATGRTIELVSFGITQLEVFAKMLTAGKEPDAKIKISHVEEGRK